MTSGRAILIFLILGLQPFLGDLHGKRAGINYRLPKSTQPKSYHLHLKVDLGTFKFEGKVKINVSIVSATKDIVLHSENLKFSSIKVTSGEGEDFSVKNISNSVTHFLTLHSNTEFYANETYQIEIEYIGTLSDDMFGFYKSSYKTKDGQIKWLATTQFESSFARRAFPCFDEPELKSTFDIEIETPPSYHALSNMPIYNVSTTSNGWKTFHFEKTGPMSTYLVAFVVSDFESLEGIEKYKLQGWSRSDAVNMLKFGKDIGSKCVDFYEKYFGINYAFPKIDQVAIPDFAAGAMENWGLITYRESSFLRNEELYAETQKVFIARVIAHELAHQWFGNLVTLRWWDYLWLNEGFATYFEHVTLSAVEPKWRILGLQSVNVLQSAFIMDSLESISPLTTEVNSREDAQEKFDSITYLKGASVIRMLSHVLTAETFQKGLKKYLSKHQYSNTIPKDLFSALEEQRKADRKGQYAVQLFFEPWTTQPGYPFIQVDKYDDHVTVKQSRFTLKDIRPRKRDAWWIPLTWTVKSKGPAQFTTTEPMDWITPSDNVKIIKHKANASDWIIFNNQQTGYYRVNYDIKVWKLISKQLIKRHKEIHVVNRAQLVDDSLNLARGGYLNYTIALKLVSYIKDEEDYVPWASALMSFSFLNQRLSKVYGYEHFRKYLLGLTDKLYKKLGFVDKGNDMMVHLQREDIRRWACRLGNQDCVKKAKEMFHNIRKGELSSVQIPLKSLVFCIGIKLGSKEEWDFVWEDYKRLEVDERRAVIGALGCSNSTTILTEFLQKLLSPKSGLWKQDVDYVFPSVYNNPEGIGVAFDFLMKNWKTIAQQHGGLFVIRVAYGICDKLTATQADRLEKFLKSNRKTLGIPGSFIITTMEYARTVVGWTKRNSKEIIAWAKRYEEGEKDNNAKIKSASSTVQGSMILHLLCCFLFFNQLFRLW